MSNVVKKNLFIIIGAVAVVVMVAVVGILLYGEIGVFNDVSGKLDLSKQQLGRFYHSQPFPSPENVTKENANVEVLNAWFRNLTDDLRKGEVAVPEKNPGTLQKFMQETQRELIKEAEKRGTVVPSNFLFGFQRYESGTIPSPTHVPRLTEQLIVIDMISRMLFESGAKELTQVTRREFEDAATPAAGKGRPFQSQAVPVSPQTPAAKPKENLYQTDHFCFEFKAKEAAIIDFLNRLSRHGVFIAVTSLDVEREGPDILPAPAPLDLGEKALDATKKAESAGEPEQKATEGKATAPAPVKPKRGLPKEQRIVSGPTLEKPMKVKIEMDVYRFSKQDNS